MPISLDDQYKGYFSIGHPWNYQNPELARDYAERGIKKIIVWGIDENLQFHQKEVNDGVENHGMLSTGDFLASGRYEVSEREPQGVCSYAEGFPFNSRDVARREFLRKKMIQILDKKFNNPKIVPTGGTRANFI